MAVGARGVISVCKKGLWCTPKCQNAPSVCKTGLKCTPIGQNGLSVCKKPGICTRTAADARTVGHDGAEAEGAARRLPGGAGK